MKKTLLVIGALLTIVLLHVAGVLRPVEDGLRWGLLPAARLFASVGNAGAPKSECLELQSRLSSVSVDYVRLKALEEENIALRKVAKFLNDSGYDHVGARVIARSSLPLSSTVLIDRGSHDGLELGMAVVAGDGVYLGKITSLADRVSTVTLVTDETSRVAASLAGTRKLVGMVEGKGNGVAELTLVPQAEPMKTDDVVVTAGTEEKIPPNLVIATVDQIQGKPTDPFKTATLDALSRSEDLDLVVVLLPTALNPSQVK